MGSNFNLLGSHSLKRHPLFIVTLLFTFVLAQVSFVPPSYASSAPLAVSPPVGETALQSAFQSELSTYVDPKTDSFAVFSSKKDGELPRYMGKTEWKEGRYQFTANRKITPVGDLYILTDPRNPHFLQIMEKLPEGGFGRLLRHREEGIDLEFVYDDKAAEVTILDYRAGRFFRVSFTEKSQDPLSLAARPDEKGREGEIVATVTPPVKMTVLNSGFISHPSQEGSRLHSLIEIPTKEAHWNARHLRGPPRGEIKS